MRKSYDYLNIDKFLKIKESLSSSFRYFNSKQDAEAFVKTENSKIHTFLTFIYDDKSCKQIIEKAEKLIQEKIDKDYKKIQDELEDYLEELKNKFPVALLNESNKTEKTALIGGAAAGITGIALSVALAPLALIVGAGMAAGGLIESGNKKTKLINTILEYQEKGAKEAEENVINAIEKIILDYYKVLINNFSIDDLIKNPQNIDKINEKLYMEAARNIERFGSTNAELKKFSEDIRTIVENSEAIKEQNKLYLKYLNSINVEDKYYDNNDYKLLEKDIVPIKKALNDFNRIFYNFNYIDNINDFIANHNEKFINKHLNDTFFSKSADGFCLDTEQRKAILQDEVSSLIIAGAGCGKTTTIIGKLNYLINVKHVDPKHILLLSFGKDVSKKLEEDSSKINKKVKVATFHKLGLEILENASEEKLITDTQYGNIIWQFFHQNIFKRENEKTRNNLIKYFSYFINPIDYEKHYNNKSEMYNEINRQDLKTLKYYAKSKNLRTLNKEEVKSFEELTIANFYFLNGVNYEYEKPYVYKTADKKHRQYLPDFYLPDYDLWHEHYGVDEHMKAWQYSKETSKKYLKSMIWKEKVHAENNTTCIKTYSYQFKNNTIIEDLTKELKKHKVVFKKRSSQEINDCLYSVCSGYSYDSFITLVSTFISLYKSKYQDEKKFDEFKNIKFPNKFMQQRTLLFLDICKAAYLYYKKAIKGKIDFDDMIIQSTNKLGLTKLKNKYKYKYILVDEFQDISFSRKELLRALIKHGDSKLFAVGDDWQSIFRFTGSDLDIFVNFKNHFGNYARMCYITNTHRNSQNLQDIAGPFIKRNSEQLDKRIISNDPKIQINYPVEIIYCHEDKGKQFSLLLDKIYQQNPKAKILILGRNNHDIEMINSNELNIIVNNNGNRKKLYRIESKKYKDLKIRFSTVHSAKGLEEEFVILINAENATLGFPNKVEDDYVLNLVLSHENKYLYAEERRLWYVALTRTKSYVYILSEARNPSEFIKEIEGACVVFNKDGEEETHVCPECGGKLEKRVGKSGKSFWKCKNYPLCEYAVTEHEIDKIDFNQTCPECGDYLIKRKKGKNEFYGCHSYPFCKYTKNIKKDDDILLNNVKF